MPQPQCQHCLSDSVSVALVSSTRRVVAWCSTHPTRPLLTLSSPHSIKCPWSLPNGTPPFCRTAKAVRRSPIAIPSLPRAINASRRRLVRCRSSGWADRYSGCVGCMFLSVTLSEVWSLVPDSSSSSSVFIISHVSVSIFSSHNSPTQSGRGRPHLSRASNNVCTGGGQPPHA